MYDHKSRTGLLRTLLNFYNLFTFSLQRLIFHIFFCSSNNHHFLFLPPCFLITSQPIWALNPISSLACTIGIFLFHHSPQSINMIFHFPPLKILSRSFQLHSISQLHCLAKSFQRVVYFTVATSSFSILPRKHTIQLVSITPLRLLPSKDLFVSTQTCTWPSPVLIPSPPLTWFGSCMGHRWLLLSSWNISIQCWGTS